MLIGSMFALSVIAALVVSLALPKYYKSTTVVIAAESGAGGLGAALSSLPFAGALAGAAGIQTPADKIMVILKSRTVAEAVIQRFNLLRVFNEDSWDGTKNAWKDPAEPPLTQDAVKFLTENVMSVNKSKEGAITLSVEWKDPKLAGDMANYYISALTGFLNDKSINVTIQVVDRAVPAERKSRPGSASTWRLAWPAFSRRSFSPFSSTTSNGCDPSLKIGSRGGNGCCLTSAAVYIMLPPCAAIRPSS
jgi:hypothetical protein